MAAANGGSQSAAVEKIQNEVAEADPDPTTPPSAPPAPPSVTVSSGGFIAIAKRFAQHFPLLLGLYLAGYFRMSLVWIVGAAGLTAAREQWRKERDFRMNAARLANFVDEEDIIKARLVDLPSWVFFPDFERAEWINKILKSVWPNVSKYVENLIVVSIEPSIREALNAYKLTGFKFEKMQLGAIPLRVGGVKAYDRNVARNEIIMDLDICYAGNCDFRFSVKGIKAGIKDFQIKGLLRCIMKPLVDSSPFVGGLQLFFLNNPDVDFNLLGMADVLDMPGLADIMRRIISDQIGAIMVLPNKISVKLSDTVKVETLKMHEPAGVLRVRVIEAKDLMRMDVGMLGKGKSDPYAVINVGSQEFRTKTIMNTVNPKWNFNCEMNVESLRAQVLYVRLWDYDPGFIGMQNDDYLGRASVDINSIAKAGKKDMWAKLEDASTGSIHLEMTWFNLSSDHLRLKDHTAETISIGLSSAVVSVFVDSAKMLPRAARSSSQPEAYAILSVGSKTVQTTVQQRSCDPIWEQAFSFLVCNPESDDLHIKVMDQKTNSEIGRCKIVLVSLLAERDMSISHQPLALKNSGPESKIIISVQLRVMVQGAEEAASSQHAPLAPKPSNATPSATPVAKVAPVSIPEPVKPKAPLQPTPSVAPSVDKTKEKVVVPLSQKPAVSQPDVPAVVTKPAPSHVEEAIEEVESVTIERPEVSERNIESMLTSAMAPLAAPSGLNLPAEVALTPSLRRRNVGSDVNCGRVQLTLRYSSNRQKFVVVVHQAENLPGGDDQDPPDPYVKLYLLPDRKESGKRKTEAIKDSVNPHYDESFEFPVSLSELPSRNLEVSVLSKQKQSFFHKIPLLGLVKIDLSVFNWQQPTTEWFDLRPGTEKYVAN